MTHEDSLRAPRRLITRSATLALSARGLLDRSELFSIEKRNDQLRSQAKLRPLHVAVVGPYSAGKSSFINAIIGKGYRAGKRHRPLYSGLLPVGVMAKTAIRTRVVSIGDGDSEAVFARFSDGGFQQLAGDDAGRLIGLSGGGEESPFERELTARRKAIREIEYRLRLPEGFDNVVLIDTPGIDSMQDDHDELARDAVRNADAVLFLTEDHVTEAEKRFVMDVKDWVGSIIFVQTRCDREDDPLSVKELTASNGRTMTEWLGLPVRPFIATSAFAEIDAQSTTGNYDGPVTDGFQAVMCELEALLRDRISLRYDMAAREALNALGDIRPHLEARRSALRSLKFPLDLNTDERDERTRAAAARTALANEINHVIADLHARIDHALRSCPDAWEARLYAEASPYRSGRGAAETCVGKIQRKARTLYEVELKPQLVEILKTADLKVLAALQTHVGIRMPLVALVPELPQLRAPIMNVGIVRGFLAWFGIQIPKPDVISAARSAAESVFSEVRRVAASRASTLAEVGRHAATQAEERTDEALRGTRVAAAAAEARRAQIASDITVLLESIDDECRDLLECLERAHSKMESAT